MIKKPIIIKDPIRYPGVTKHYEAQAKAIGALEIRGLLKELSKEMVEYIKQK